VGGAALARTPAAAGQQFDCSDLALIERSIESAMQLMELDPMTQAHLQKN